MPFTETDIVDERTRFIEDAHRSLHSFTWLCEQYGIEPQEPSTNGWTAGDRTVPGLRNRSSRMLLGHASRSRRGHPRGPTPRLRREEAVVPRE